MSQVSSRNRTPNLLLRAQNLKVNPRSFELDINASQACSIIDSIVFNLGYQIRSRHALLKMVSGTKKEEDKSVDNINILLITSTSLMVFSCIMEVLIYFLYNNRV